ncbi:hypothetical protein NBT05_11290 [Aquimarina sp. ERC-38]|uniref:hypothetical protein n=1 Tax=Aquimarina sp. ERC-38 TaxID=2949996 RepID=UPI0022484C7A|nr:hypothetical protein [Aquimarina sp. ERC-38]UZO79542.1 hypothetical protein NBT05_11290 [Aquimarina sp. ERC-38]
MIEIVDALESKITLLLDKYQQLEQQRNTLQERIIKLEEVNKLQVEEVKHWQEKCSAMKNAQAMLGSNEYKKETKHKINTLIREIDACIAYLSE